MRSQHTYRIEVLFCGGENIKQNVYVPSILTNLQNEGKREVYALVPKVQNYWNAKHKKQNYFYDVRYFYNNFYTYI